MRHAPLALTLALAAGLAATPTASPGNSAAQCALTAFRVRSDFEADLNVDAGWAGATGANVPVATDQPFRIRLEVEADDPEGTPRRFWLQYRHNGGEW